MHGGGFATGGATGGTLRLGIVGVGVDVRGMGGE